MIVKKLEINVILRAFCMIILGEYLLVILLSETSLLILLLIFIVATFKNKIIVGNAIIYRDIPSVPRYLVMIILLAKPNILIMKPANIIILVLIKKLFFRKKLFFENFFNI
jgi:hypothetical protein